MSGRETRIGRRAVGLGLLGLAGAGLAAGSRPSPLELPPTYGHVLRMGDDLTYAAQRLLLPRRSLVREYGVRDISSMPAIGTTDPADASQGYFDPAGGALYDRLRRGGFADWRLSVEGAVARPRRFTLAELMALPRRTQITRHTCEEGWSAIAEWIGAPLATVLAAVGASPAARFVTFHAFDAMADGVDMIDALHPQTILAFGMNGRPLPPAHGAPLRVRIETQLGYKSLKFLHRIVVSEHFEDPGKLGPIQTGWSWYAGI